MTVIIKITYFLVKTYSFHCIWPDVYYSSKMVLMILEYTM